MRILPRTQHCVILRTDFWDEEAWESITSAIQNPNGEFRASVTLVNSPEYDGATPQQIRSLIPPSSEHTFIFIVDPVAISHAEHPVLVMDLETEPGRTFRVVPSQIGAVENNLSIANMDFSEFADAADRDGIFRGFANR